MRAQPSTNSAENSRKRPAFMHVAEELQLIAEAFPARVNSYPEFRYMGSKHRLLPWLHGIFSQLDFETAEDPFCGVGNVAYLMKAMGKSVRASDFLAFPSTSNRALVANSTHSLSSGDVGMLLTPRSGQPDFIERKFSGIFFTPSLMRRKRRVSLI